MKFKSTLVPALVTALMAGAAPAENVRAAAQTAAAQPPGCDEQCLVSVMDRFIAAMTAGRSEDIPLAQHAEVRENARIVPLTATAWTGVKMVRSRMTFADPVTGNVIARTGVELAGGKAGYISTRLKAVAGGRITDVELSSDTSTAVVAPYVWNLDPEFSSVLPPEQRMSRMALEALARRYFHSLSTHEAVRADFDERCNRFHSGRQITNTAVNTVEGGAPRTCAGSLEGNPPWGPATEQRFPVIDPARGVVLGVTLLHYPKLPDQPQMYVSEIFKVVGGRIVRIDNIGLMLQGVTTIGFAHEP